MSRIFFDTEFYENGKTIELISIGLVTEDGREYYAETDCADATASCSAWLRENVLPHLTGPQKPRAMIAREIVEFAGERPEFWANYAAYDWVVLCQLFGTMMDLPKGWPMFCRDLQQVVDGRVIDWPGQEGDAHNALDDARYLRKCHALLAGTMLARRARALAQPNEEKAA
jgi:hypothetical protein